MGDYIIVARVGYQEIRSRSSSSDCNCDCSDCDCVTPCAFIFAICAVAALVILPCVDLAYTISSSRAGAIEGSLTYVPLNGRRMWGFSDYSNICGDLRRISVPHVGGHERMYGGPVTFCRLPNFTLDRDKLCDLARKTDTNGALKLAGCILYMATIGLAALSIASVIFFSKNESYGRTLLRISFVAFIAMTTGAILEIIAIAGQRTIVSGYKGSSETHYTSPAYTPINSFMFASGILKLIFSSISSCVVFAKMRKS